MNSRSTLTLNEFIANYKHPCRLQRQLDKPTPAAAVAEMSAARHKRGKVGVNR